MEHLFGMHDGTSVADLRRYDGAYKESTRSLQYHW